MNKRIVNYTSLVSLAELKTNLRIVDDTSFDTELQLKLNAAISSASKFIGVDLTTIENFSCSYADSINWILPSVYYISQVVIGQTTLLATEWAYSDGKLLIYKEGEFEGETVSVTVAYNDDIKVAILMHASALFENPVDSVEQLPKASQNMLRQYRYGR